jgi:hypothetical protein
LLKSLFVSFFLFSCRWGMHALSLHLPQKSGCMLLKKQGMHTACRQEKASSQVARTRKQEEPPFWLRHDYWGLRSHVSHSWCGGVSHQTKCGKKVFGHLCNLIHVSHDQWGGVLRLTKCGKKVVYICNLTCLWLSGALIAGVSFFDEARCQY